MNLDALRAAAFPLDGGDRHLVPEPVVKEWLASRGVPVPASGDARSLGEPLVVKAYGPGIVHKSDLGAVRVGIARSEVNAVQTDMAERLAPAGFLVEELVPPGIELIVGVVDTPGFGPVLAIGLGGTLAEILDDTAVSPLPVTSAEVREMIDELRGAAVLHGARGAAGADLDAVALLAVRLSEAASELGPHLAELECNPVIARPDGVTAVDARLVLQHPAPQRGAAPPATDFGALFAPTGIAVAGASATKVTFGNRSLAALRDYGWTEGLAAIHPSATSIDGVPAYPSVDDVPHGVDYVIAAVPAASCAELVASSSRARFVHVISGGFREAGGSGGDLETALVDAARAAGVRVLGPNCMGVFAPEGRLAFQLDSPRQGGRVSVLSQSGGLAGDLVKAGDLRGLRYSKLVSMGNAADVTPGELLDWLVEDPDTDVIGLYLEDPRDGTGLVRALERAAGLKPVVALVGGLSAQGARAVASHTGALAADARIWRGISRSTGTTVVSTLEDLLGCLAHLQRWATVPVAAPVAHDVLIAGVGGGATVLTTDACDRAGLVVTELSHDARQVLRDRGYGVGTSIVNPVEIPIGPAVAPDALAGILAAVLDRQSFTDVLVHLNVQSYFSYASDGAEKLVPFVEAMGAADLRGARLALVPRLSEVAPPEVQQALAAACVRHGVVAHPTLDGAATAIAAIQRFSARSAPG